MEPLAPQKIYATQDVRDDARALARAERMAAAMDGPPIEWVDYDRLCELVAERAWADSPRWGARQDPRDPDVVLTMGKFDSNDEKAKRAERWPALRTRDLLGHRAWVFRPDGEPAFKERTKGIVCQSACQLHTITGCMYRCAYCDLGAVIRVPVNVEECVSHLDEWLTACPGQRIVKWGNVSDVTCYEPEYDADRLLVEYFARRENEYLEIYVGKSANVDHLLDMDHRGRTIMQWSVSARTQSEALEPKTANWAERVEAARKCQQAGYIVRFRFSPIIPVRGWRQENTELVDRLFDRTTPDVISLCAFGWMDYDDAARCIDMDLIDPDFAAAMKAAAPFLRERGYTSGGGRPIPHDARYMLFDHLVNEIQRRSPKTVIALCLETPEMWRAFAKRLGQDPTDYVCNCGPQCTPGGELYDKLVGTAPLTAPA